jgi:hypothetical protein
MSELFEAEAPPRSDAERIAELEARVTALEGAPAETPAEEAAEPEPTEDTAQEATEAETPAQEAAEPAEAAAPAVGGASSTSTA